MTQAQEQSSALCNGNRVWWKHQNGSTQLCVVPNDSKHQRGASSAALSA